MEKGKRTFLDWLRSWPFDWVSAVMFVCVLACFTLIFLPLNKGTNSVGEMLSGEGQIFNPYQEPVNAGDNTGDDQGDEPVVDVSFRNIESLREGDESSPLYAYYKLYQRVNVLLLGVNDGMTDTIMLASYDLDNQKVDIISIPRDTYYYRSGYSEVAFHKINSIMHSQGITRLAQAVSETLYGIPINYYVVVDYDAVVKIMNAIGGVQMNIPFHMKYDDTTPGKELHVDIPAGMQTINGNNVMGFLRFRKTNPSYEKQGYHGYPGGDIQRIQVQQEFVKTVIKECLKLKNLDKVLSVAQSCITSDLNYEVATRVAAKAMGGLSGDNVTTHTLPGTDILNGGLSFWQVNSKETLSMLEDIFVPKDGESEEGEGEASGGN